MKTMKRNVENNNVANLSIEQEIATIFNYLSAAISYGCVAVKEKAVKGGMLQGNNQCLQQERTGAAAE